MNPAAYRRQVAAAFQHDTPRIAQELLAVKETAEALAQQRDYLGAVTIYETLVTEIFEQSHLYFDDEARYDDYYEEEAYYPEEEGLDDLVGRCIEALGNCLEDAQADRTAREEIINVLFDVYQHDLHAESGLGFAASAADQLAQYTTLLERQALAKKISVLLADEEEKIGGSQRKAYGAFLLALGKDTIDDETYLRICRETGRTHDLVDRLLTLGRVDEAASETQRFDDYALLELADLFIQHGQHAVAERLVKTRAEKKPDLHGLHVLGWLQKYYQTRGNHVAELEIVETLFRAQPFLRRYQELRALATQLARWETLRPELIAFLEQAGKTTLLIQIALDEGEIDKALHLLKGIAKKDRNGYTYNDGYGYYGYGDIALEVALAAEETHPREAIELYRQYGERLIALRGRQNYQSACKYLATMRTLYDKLGEHEAWTTCIAALREQNRALKEELANAGL